MSASGDRPNMPFKRTDFCLSPRTGFSTPQCDWETIRAIDETDCVTLSLHFLEQSNDIAEAYHPWLVGDCANPHLDGLTTVSANAQARTWRLGLLTPGSDESIRPGSIRKTTLQELSERGFSEGRNLVYLSAAAEGNLSRLPELARMLAQERGPTSS
jgi:hypothetical protein